MRFFNTYSRQVEEFVPLDPSARNVRMYTCGPTVYSRAHIGNFRAYVFEDLLQRHLELRGYKVQRVMNLTDVDDKTIRGAREAKIPLVKFTAPFKEAFFADLETLRIKPADQFPAATDQHYIDRMIAMIEMLVARGLAYQAEDKSVYFRISKFPNYGKLSHIDLTQLQSTGRVQHDEYDKEHIGDFALWKARDEEDGDVGWQSPWGRGRPGWHIECSAMATTLLGEQLDIHCGGIDNIFPHHEDEIAQSEGCTGKQFVRYWLHCAHLVVDGQKMSKSLGNFYTIPDLVAKGYSGREIRYALMRVHYRAPLNFTWEGMEEVRQALGRIDEWVLRLTEFAKEGRFVETGLVKYANDFFAALDDDLNISAGLRYLFDLITHTNRAMHDGALDAGSVYQILDMWKRIDSILRIGPDDVRITHRTVKPQGTEAKAASGIVFIDTSGKERPPEIDQLAEAREQARDAKDWQRSDELRNKLAALGWEVRDTKGGQTVTRRAGMHG